MTNIDRDALNKIKYKKLTMKFGRYELDDISRSYSEVKAGFPLAIFGSRDLLELSVNKGNAAEILKLKNGTKVFIKPRTVTSSR